MHVTCYTLSSLILIVAFCESSTTLDVAKVTTMSSRRKSVLFTRKEKTHEKQSPHNLAQITESSMDKNNNYYS